MRRYTTVLSAVAGVAVCCGGLALVGGGVPALADVAVIGAAVTLTVLDVALGLSRGTPSFRGARIVRPIMTVVLPWNLAALLFAPRHRLAPEDAVIGVLSRVRVALGLAIVVGVAVWYRTYDRLQPIAFLESWAVTALLAIPSVLLFLGLVAVVTRAPLRPDAIRQMSWPALSLLGFAVTLVLFAGFVKGGDFVSGYLKVHGVRLPLDYVHGGVFGVWFLFFAFRGAYLIAQNWFNTVDAHLLLPPLIATWMAWLVAGVSLINQAGGGPPRPVALVLILGGAAATTVIATLEGWRAVRRYGVTLRDGPWPARQPRSGGVVSELGDGRRVLAAGDPGVHRPGPGNQGGPTP
jgi:hypothetical protein